MTYVRTKDGIWEIMEIKPNYEIVYYHCKHNLIGERFEEKEIIKQADSIKELCDRCVVLYQYSQRPFVKTFYEAEDIEQWKRKIRSNNPIVAIYGAIWTKGVNDEPILKSVAKMNEKGELELL